MALQGVSLTCFAANVLHCCTALQQQVNCDSTETTRGAQFFMFLDPAQPFAAWSTISITTCHNISSVYFWSGVIEPQTQLEAILISRDRKRKLAIGMQSTLRTFAPHRPVLCRLLITKYYQAISKQCLLFITELRS